MTMRWDMLCCSINAFSRWSHRSTTSNKNTKLTYNFLYRIVSEISYLIFLSVYRECSKLTMSKMLERNVLFSSQLNFEVKMSIKICAISKPWQLVERGVQTKVRKWIPYLCWGTWNLEILLRNPVILVWIEEVQLRYITRKFSIKSDLRDKF